MDVNQYEIGLLHENPGELVVKYQPIVMVIVRVFMKSGYFRGEEKEEIVQCINEKLLERMGKIRMQYNGISRLRTYFSAVIRNLCLEMIRKGRNQYIQQLLEEQDHSLSYTPDQLGNLIIQQEMERLGFIMKMYHEEQERIEMFFLAMFQFPLPAMLFRRHFPPPYPPELRETVKVLLKGRIRSDRQVFRFLSVMVNHFQNKRNTSDALRKWMKTREEEILKLLNGDPPRACHDHETLMILLERYLYDRYRHILVLPAAQQTSSLRYDLSLNIQDRDGLPSL